MGALKSTHCSKGHPLTEGNLYYSNAGTKRETRECKSCSRARSQAFRMAKAVRHHKYLARRSRKLLAETVGGAT